MSSGCKDKKRLHGNLSNSALVRNNLSSRDCRTVISYYRNFFTYGSMLNKENTRQLVAYQLENDD